MCSACSAPRVLGRPGSQGSRTEADSCFAKVVVGFEVVERMLHTWTYDGALHVLTLLLPLVRMDRAHTRGTRLNDGQETGSMGAAAATLACSEGA